MNVKTQALPPGLQMFAAAPESSAPTVVRVAALAPTKVTEMQSGDVEFVMVLCVHC